MSRELPILCNTQVVQNILAGRQTQDRRLIKGPLPELRPYGFESAGGDLWSYKYSQGGNGTLHFTKSKYQPGDLLYVRETWRLDSFGDFGGDYGGWVDYQADGDSRFVHLMETYGDFWDTEARLKQWCEKHDGDNYSPNIHMPKWAARIWLKVTDVRVERIQDISEVDSVAEGYDIHDHLYANPSDWFSDLWDSIYPGSWERNDWVFVYEFERVDK